MNGNPIDLVIVGMGEDGHTSSLFPGLFNPNDEAIICAVENSTKPPSCRISMTIKGLLGCNKVIAVVGGAGKAKVLNVITYLVLSKFIKV